MQGVSSPSPRNIVRISRALGVTADELLRDYAAQLRLYARAIGLRLAPTPITRCTLYSFALGREVDVPLRGM